LPDDVTVRKGGTVNFVIKSKPAGAKLLDRPAGIACSKMAQSSSR